MKPKNGQLLHTEYTLSLSRHTHITESKQRLHKWYLWGSKVWLDLMCFYILFLAYAIRCCVLSFQNLKVEPLKRKEKKRKTGKQERVWWLERKSKKKKLPIGSLLDFTLLLNRSWDWGVFALARRVVCNLSWFFCTCEILHEIQSGTAYTDHSCSSHPICKAWGQRPQQMARSSTMLVGYLAHWRNSWSQFLKFSKDQFQFGSGSFFLKIETPFRFPF